LQPSAEDPTGLGGMLEEKKEEDEGKQGERFSHRRCSIYQKWGDGWGVEKRKGKVGKKGECDRRGRGAREPSEGKWSFRRGRGAEKGNREGASLLFRTDLKRGIKGEPPSPFKFIRTGEIERRGLQREKSFKT